jgi:formylglycine-generating enzyme required for sulfatase activity
MCAYERPAVRVKLGPYWIQRNEFTVEAALAWALRAGVATLPGPPTRTDERPAHPAHDVNFDVARAYCRAMGGDLPTEAQWEFAAHHGDPQRVYPWGSGPPTCDRAVTGDHNCSHGRTDVVCSRPAGNTPEGLCDMAGNVWEWTRWNFDGLDPEGMVPYAVPATDDLVPGGAAPGGAWEQPEPRTDASAQPIRGGGHWHTALFFNRSRARFSMPREAREGNIGFRCVWPGDAFPLPAAR